MYWGTLSWVGVDFRPVPYPDIAETSHVVNGEQDMCCDSLCL